MYVLINLVTNILRTILIHGNTEFQELYLLQSFELLIRSKNLDVVIFGKIKKWEKWGRRKQKNSLGLWISIPRLLIRFARGVTSHLPFAELIQCAIKVIC